MDSESTLTKGSTTKLRITVRPNAHEPGRANVAILNPEKLPVVAVDLSGVLKPGQKYRVVSVKDFFGPPVLQGAYDGDPVRVPMQPRTPPAPVGMSDFEFPINEPHFAAFVVLPE